MGGLVGFQSRVGVFGKDGLFVGKVLADMDDQPVDGRIEFVTPVFGE